MNIKDDNNSISTLSSQEPDLIKIPILQKTVKEWYSELDVIINNYASPEILTKAQKRAIKN